MNGYDTAKAETDRKLVALETKLDDSLCKLREKGEALLKRKYDLTKREKELIGASNTLNVNGSDLIELNVGGTKMAFRRETLTLIKGSRLEALFNGIWDDRFLRDKDDCIFMDLDPFYFKKIIDYLCLLKLSSGSNEFRNIYKFDPQEQEGFDFYVNFFRLCPKMDEFLSESCSSNIGNQTQEIVQELNTAKNHYDDVLSCFDREEKELTLEEAKLKKMEENLEKEEHFFSLFVKGTADDPILHLSVDGEVIQTKQSTLCLCEGSFFAEHFQDDQWIAENILIVDDKSSNTILVEVPSPILTAIINQLRFRTMMNPEDILPSIEVKNENDSLLERFVSVLFPGKCDFITGIESNIPLPNYNQIELWLAEVNTNIVPELLYRASRDGWKANDFHRKCDSKGATLTIVTTKEGYVFGGYNDHSWCPGIYQFSNKAFMFSMRCHADLPPTKMKLKVGCNQNAVYTNFSHGPCFGSGIDLVVGYNGDLRSGYTNLGRTYELPEGAWNTFLTGKHGSNKKFQVAEVEVFKV